MTDKIQTTKRAKADKPRSRWPGQMHTLSLRLNHVWQRAQDFDRTCTSSCLLKVRYSPCRSKETEPLEYSLMTSPLSSGPLLSLGTGPCGFFLNIPPSRLSEVSVHIPFDLYKTIIMTQSVTRSDHSRSETSVLLVTVQTPPCYLWSLLCKSYLGNASWVFSCTPPRMVVGTDRSVHRRSWSNLDLGWWVAD